MPMYEFVCSKCNLQFEKLIRGQGISETPCLDCDGVAVRQLSGFGFQFASGKVVGNSGVDSLDSSVDRNVGRNAEARWETIKDRQAFKRTVQRDNGGLGKVPLTRDSITGEYIPTPVERLERLNSLHAEYEDMYRENKKHRESKGVGKFPEDDPYSRYKARLKKEG